MIARLFILAVAFMCCSCSGESSHGVSSTDSGPNVTASTWGNWTITCVIDARAYRPGEPIGVTVRLASDPERPLPDVVLRCELLDSENNVVRKADHLLKFVVFRQPSFHAEAVIKGAFPDAANPHSEQFVAPDGPYALQLALVVDSKVVVEFEKRPISVGYPHNR